MKRFILRRCSAFLVYGEVSKLALVDLGVVADKVHVAQNTVDVTGILGGETQAKAEGLNLRARLGWGGDARVIGYLGKFSKAKAVEVLLDAFLELRSKGFPNLRLILAGDGSERAFLEKKAATSPFHADIYVPGRVPDGGEPAYFQAFDLAVSVRASGLSILEAMAHAKPVLIMPERVPETELVSHGDTGFIAADLSESAFKKALSEAVQHPDLEAVGRQARARILARATHEKMVATFDAAVVEALSAVPAG